MWYGKEEKVANSNGLLERYSQLKDKVRYKKKEIREMEEEMSRLEEKIRKEL